MLFQCPHIILDNQGYIRVPFLSHWLLLGDVLFGQLRECRSRGFDNGALMHSETVTKLLAPQNTDSLDAIWLALLLNSQWRQSIFNDGSFKYPTATWRLNSHELRHYILKAVLIRQENSNENLNLIIQHRVDIVNYNWYSL